MRPQSMRRPAVVCVLWLMVSAAAWAQSYPVKPVRIMVGFSPGGGADVVARGLAPRLGEGLGQQVIVDNRPGANGLIAADLTAKAAPDGHMLLLSPGNYAFGPAMDPKWSLDMTAVFTGVSLLAESPLLVVVHPSLPVKSMQQLIALAKANPDKLSYASGGVGGSGHLAVELFRTMTDVRAVHIPYKGTGAAVFDLIGGQVPLCFCTLPSVMPHVKSGRLRPLAVTTKRRSSALPDIPTVAESGVPPYEMSQWYGLLAPAAVPSPVVDRINAEIAKVLKLPEIRTRLQADGAEPAHSSPQAFTAFFKAEIAKWTSVVKKAGIRP
jgi:tripartite-type tricarboxylate transporter receptor subunit TctC